MSSIAKNLETVREQITKACLAWNRSPSEVKLVAVSKNKTVEDILEAYEAGQRVFGESYVQELIPKAKALSYLTDLEWHFIGHLQSNKVKLLLSVLNQASIVHSVHSIFMARELAKRAPSPLKILIEINVAGESQKYGIQASDLELFLHELKSLAQLHVLGLMTIPPPDRRLAEKAFETLALLRSLHGGVEVLPELSMGMSDDLDLAIRHGATYVRVGTAIFGERVS